MSRAYGIRLSPGISCLVKAEVILMRRPVLLVSSVTHAFKGQELLKQRGIPSHIIRNAEFKALGSCGYAVVPYADPVAAQNILNRGGVRVLRILDAEVGS